MPLWNILDWESDEIQVSAAELKRLQLIAKIALSWVELPEDTTPRRFLERLADMNDAYDTKWFQELEAEI